MFNRVLNMKRLFLGISFLPAINASGQKGIKLGVGHNTADVEYYNLNQFVIGQFNNSFINLGFSLSFWGDYKFSENFSFTPAIGARSRGLSGKISSTNTGTPIELESSIYCGFVYGVVKFHNPLNMIFGRKKHENHYIGLGNRWDVKILEYSNANYKNNFSQIQLITSSMVASMGWYIPLNDQDKFIVEFEFTSSFHSNNTNGDFRMPSAINKVRYLSYFINFGYI